MIPSETNRPPDEVDTVIVTLTTGWKIPSETNRPPDEVDTVIETLTTGGMIPRRQIDLRRSRHSDSNTDYWGDDTIGD